MKIYLFIVAFMAMLPTQVVLCRGLVDLSTTLTVARDTVPDDAKIFGMDKEEARRSAKLVGNTIVATLSIVGALSFGVIGYFALYYGNPSLGLLNISLAASCVVLFAKSVRRIRNILDGEPKKKHREPSKRME
jgi:hypothetical protein